MKMEDDDPVQEAKIKRKDGNIIYIRICSTSKGKCWMLTTVSGSFRPCSLVVKGFGKREIMFFLSAGCIFAISDIMIAKTSISTQIKNSNSVGW